MKSVDTQQNWGKCGLGDVEIRPISAGELEDACRVLGLAFADNPNTLAVVREDRAAARRVMQAVTRVAKLGRKYSHVLVAKNGGEIVGVLNAARWPQCQLRSGEKVMKAPALIGILRSAVPRQLKIVSAWKKHDPRQPHWHVGPLGVHPDFQGRGVGTALMISFFSMVDDQGLPVYLETDVDRNVVLYERLGFRIIAQELILGINNRFMWRDARHVLRQVSGWRSNRGQRER